MVQIKHCSACGQDKPVDEFHVCRGRPDGRQTRCKRCKIKDNLRYAARNPSQMRINCRKHYHKDKAKSQAYARQRRKIKPAGYLAAERKWKAANPDKVIAAVHLRRARLANVGGSFTATEWQDKLAEYDGKCAYCSCAGKMTRQHVVPISKGGSNSIENIVPACLGCNLSIGAKIVYPPGWKSSP